MPHNSHIPRILFLLPLLWLAACGNASPTATPPPPTATTEISPPPASEAAPTSSPAAERFVQATEIEGQAWLEETQTSPAVPVQSGERLPLQGTLETGGSSRARLDILPDGTVIRLGENTRLQLDKLAAQEPVSRFRLWLGKVWIILRGGQLEVETSSGVASVRGSMLGVTFDPQSGQMRVTCLEGHCMLANQAGQVSLIAGQASTITRPDAPPSPPEDMLPKERQEWRDAAPEAGPLLPPTPNAATPSSEDDASPLSLTMYNGCSNDAWPPPPVTGPWSLTLTGTDGSVYSYTLAVEETLTVYLPADSYQLAVVFPDGSTDSGILYYTTVPVFIDLCTPPPESMPDDSGSSSSLPPAATYILTNPCNDTWHWVFSGPATLRLDVPPGETVSGVLLPYGTYTAEDWRDSVISHNYTGDILPGGNLIVTASCQ